VRLVEFVNRCNCKITIDCLFFFFFRFSFFSFSSLLHSQTHSRHTPPHSPALLLPTHTSLHLVRSLLLSFLPHFLPSRPFSFSLLSLSGGVDSRRGGKERRSPKPVELIQRSVEGEGRKRGRTTWSGGGDDFEMRAREGDSERVGRVSEARCARLATPPSLGWRRRLTRRRRLPPTLFFLLLTRDAASTPRTLIWLPSASH
jgi:hypothetical protein